MCIFSVRMCRFLFTSEVRMRLIFYVYFIEISVQMNNYFESEDDCFWILDTISFAQRFQLTLNINRI